MRNCSKEPLVCDVWSLKQLLLTLFIYLLVTYYVSALISTILVKFELNWEPQDYEHMSNSYLHLSIALITFLLFKRLCNANQLTLSAIWGKKKTQAHFVILAIISGILLSVYWTSVCELNLMPAYSSCPMFIGFLFSTGLLMPLVEELFFRGILYETLRAQCHLINAILVSAVTFTIAHTNFWFDPLSLLFIFFVGTVSTLFAEYTNSLTTSFIFHTTINLTTAIDIQFY